MAKPKNNKKIKFLKLQLSAAFILLVVVLVSGVFVFTPVSWQQVAQALSPNYSKSTGDQLTVSDWNNLPNDFLDKSGDTMSGDLNMGGSHRITNLSDPLDDKDAVNKGWANSLINSKILDTSGNSLRIVCGRTPPGSTNWQRYDDVTIYVDVDTSAAGFSSTPVYLVSLGGAGNHYRTYGAQSVYNVTSNSFTVYITKLNQPSAAGHTVEVDAVDPSYANTYQWHINWCGIGQ